LILQALGGLAGGTLKAQPQPSVGVTYAAKLTREEERLDWRRPAADLARQVRALSPRPAAWFALGSNRCKVLAVAPVSGKHAAAPGTLLDGLVVACGHEALRILRIQRSGKAPMTAEEFLRGYRLPHGLVLPLPDDAAP